ncbi:type I-B CRISPR-associated protein Cas8b1/Cst1 [Chryseobacterium shandongense]|uniref:Type I-B CRISPR-associated protein Cas8b1/Cst1 n=1 Tax=Chryseobacterium shandongense TaxID=1493872 RepID=A0ABM7BFC0_9FLAO|nr:type I-B CRISPR-associated protein Cas8b1/Cst1 [Chryseobacterium shandongense]AZA97362.1 type I-B CRISPR-associated protein Cas8b1/Cst1 [Chryseobacterium shandongense]
MTFVEKINKVLDPYYALFITLGLFGTILISIYKFILSPTDLKVIVQNDDVDYPSEISKEFQSIYSKISPKDSTLIYNGTSVYNFLVTTTDVNVIFPKNWII